MLRISAFVLFSSFGFVHSDLVREGVFPRTQRKESSRAALSVFAARDVRFFSCSIRLPAVSSTLVGPASCRSLLCGTGVSPVFVVLSAGTEPDRYRGRPYGCCVTDTV